MADYGVTDRGFLIKRFQELLEENRAYAESVFYDLLEDGEVLDTTDSSIVGRLTKLVTPSSAELWEVAQDVYSSLDPEQATGVSLDVIGSYSGLTRLGEGKSITTLILGGEEGTLIPKGSVIRDNKYRTEWETSANVTLLEGSSVAIGLEPTSLDLGTVYNIKIKTLYYEEDFNIENAIPNATKNDILNLLATNLNTALTSSEIVGDLVVVQPKDIFSNPTFTYSNLDSKRVYCIVEAESVETGPISSSVGRVTDIATPILGWESSYNPFVNILGRLSESDEEFRTRIRENKSSRSSGFANSIIDSLKTVLGVKEVNLYENRTNLEDDLGLPPHSFKVIINGGNPSSIAKSIFETRPLGIGSFGDVVGVHIDDSGRPQEEMFSRPTFLEVFFDIEIDSNGEWNNQLSEELKQNIVNYFEDNMQIGGEVLYSKMFIPINKMSNQRVSSLKIGLSPDTTSYQDLEIPFDSLAVVGVSSINIIVN